MRLGSRVLAKRSTRSGKGKSWAPNAFTTELRTRCSRRRNDVEPPTRVRSTTGLANWPTTLFNSSVERHAIGEPTSRSFWPVYRCSTALNAASSTMYSVAPLRRANSRTRAVRSGPMVKVCVAP